MSAPIRRFIWHYVEMVMAMFAGMLVVSVPAEALLRAFGTSSPDLQADAPALALLGMAMIMTVPMVAWMRFRGHGWRLCNEMAASMFLPTFAVMPLLPVVNDFMLVMGIQHVAMFPAMLVAMLLRREEYSGAHGAHRTPEKASA